MNHAGMLPRFGGVAVHDAWAPYDTYADAAHQLCCANAFANCRRSPTPPRPAPRGAGPPKPPTLWSRWEELVAGAVAAGNVAVDAAALAEQVVLYRSATRLGLAETAARTGQIMKKHHALARRLIDRQADYLRFTTNSAVPPDNNGSERDIRMIKVRQKISGCLRTLTRAQQFCAIRSYISTAAKHGRHAFDTLVMLPRDDHGCPHNP
jgi:transposase